jgi:hypothetical protein
MASSASIKAVAKLPGLDAAASASSAATEKWTWAETSPVDAGSSAVYFVGDPEEIAENAKVYHDKVKLSALILSGWPLIEGRRRFPVCFCRGSTRSNYPPPRTLSETTH